MNKETLLARKAALKNNFDQIIANANAMQGAMQEIDNLIVELEKELAVAQTAVPPPVVESN